MSYMGNQLLSSIFKALGHPTRIHIIKILKDAPLCVCEILPRIESEQSNASQHLGVLRNQGILESRKEGSMVIYSIKSLEVLQMIELAEGIILRQIEETKALMSK